MYSCGLNLIVVLILYGNIWTYLLSTFWIVEKRVLKTYDCSARWPSTMCLKLCANCLKRLLRCWKPFRTSSIYNATLRIKVFNPFEDCRLSRRIFSYFVWKLLLAVLVEFVWMLQLSHSTFTWSVNTRIPVFAWSCWIHAVNIISINHLRKYLQV